MKKYLKKKYKWAEQIFNTINWTAHATAIKKGNTASTRIAIIKGIHGWQPTKKQLAMINQYKNKEHQDHVT